MTMPSRVVYAFAALFTLSALFDDPYEDALWAIRNYLDHYHLERNHQGLENKLISPEPMLVGTEGHVQSRERLGGLLRFYYRQAA